MDEKLIILMGIVLLSFTSQALSGFGSIIIAVALGSNFYPIKTLLPILVPLDVIINGYLVTRYRSKVDVPFLVKRIFPSMSVGFVAGVILFSLLESSLLKGMFGVFVVIISVRELFLTVRRSETREISSMTQAAYLALGGFIQGVFASGGPPVVYAVSRSIRDKTVFRSTLAAVWLSINSVLIATYVVTHRMTLETIGHSAVLLPIVVLGIVIGELLHRYINEKHFKIVIFCVLIVAGLSILFQLIRGI
jgi:uncharacterized membrane protein YfcA